MTYLAILPALIQGRGVDWKRKSKLETSFHYEKHDSGDENSVDDSDDDEDVIRKMAARATMHRRPTIALALMSSSEEEMNFESAWFSTNL